MRGFLGFARNDGYGGLGFGGWGRGRLLGMAQEREGAAGFLRLVDELEGAEEKTRVVGAKEEDFSLHVGRMAAGPWWALFRISSVINSIKDVKTLQCELMGLIGEVVPAMYGAVVLGAGGEDVCRWTREPGGAGFEVRRGLVQRALWEREQISNEGEETGSEGEGEQVICVPLVAIERTLGALYLGGPAGGELFREDHRYFLDSVSRIAAVTLENLLALDELRRENRSLKRALTPAVQMIGKSKAMAKVETFVMEGGAERYDGADSGGIGYGEGGGGAGDTRGRGAGGEAVCGDQLCGDSGDADRKRTVWELRRERLRGRWRSGKVSSRWRRMGRSFWMRWVSWRCRCRRSCCGCCSSGSSNGWAGRRR